MYGRTHPTLSTPGGDLPQPVMTEVFPQNQARHFGLLAAWENATLTIGR
jgi:hypothetical protein